MAENEKTPLSAHSLIHFILISLFLFGFQGYIQANDYINHGCTLGETCSGYEIPGLIMAFDLFKTFLIIIMAFRIPLVRFEKGILSRKYLFYMLGFIIGESLISTTSVYLFYNLLS